MLMKVSKLLTVEDVADRFKVKVQTVRRWILERRIDYIKHHRSVRIPSEVVERMIAEGYRPAISQCSEVLEKSSPCNFYDGDSVKM